MLLIYPKHSPFPHTVSAPLSIFCLGSYIEAKGGQVEYFDDRIQGLDYLFKLLDKKPLLAGISAMTSYQIKRGVAIASLIRRYYPEIPLVWGGVHPTMCPSQTIESGLADFIVKQEGEAALYELSQELSGLKRANFSLIDGLVWKENGRIKENKDRVFLDINSLPFPYTGAAGKMARLYADIKGPRTGITMQTSRGCNFRCRFCYNSFFHNSTSRPKTKEKLEEEFRRLKKMGISEVMFVDDNLGISAGHIHSVCELAERYCFKWSGAIRIDIIDEPLLKRLEGSGCRQLFFGIESINPRTLNYISKKINFYRANMAINLLSKSSIAATYSFMNGFPQEDHSNLKEQMDYVDNIHRADPKAEIAIQPYNPLPGTPLFEEAVRRGFKPPQRLLDWWNMTTGEVLGPWVKDKRLLKNLYLISFLAFRGDRFLKSIIFLPFHRIAKIRWKKRFFKFCFERGLYIIMVRTYIWFVSFNQAVKNAILRLKIKKI